MDTYTASEEAYKNGYERGYVDGTGDRASELLDGAIRWHRKMPNHYMPHCFVVVRDEDGVFRVYLGTFFREEAQRFHLPGYGFVDPENVVMWGEYRPVEFTVPGIE